NEGTPRVPDGHSQGAGDSGRDGFRVADSRFRRSREHTQMGSRARLIWSRRWQVTAEGIHSHSALFLCFPLPRLLVLFVVECFGILGSGFADGRRIWRVVESQPGL
ncbi:hypothetical protein CCUS01_13544, partial [Colletotrichum cuscutae]